MISFISWGGKVFQYTGKHGFNQHGPRFNMDFFQKKIARILQFNMVFIRKSNFLPSETRTKNQFCLLATLNWNNWVAKYTDWFCIYYYVDCLYKYFSILNFAAIHQIGLWTNLLVRRNYGCFCQRNQQRCLKTKWNWREWQWFCWRHSLYIRTVRP